MARKHLLGIAHLSHDEFSALLDSSDAMAEVSERDVKKVPALRGKTIINLFLEPSTRTRSSFEIAGKRLSADVINVSGDGSSVQKGETLLDTARTLQAMAPDAIVVRHKESGAAAFLAERLPETSIINAGDGLHEHPTQALLDCLTLRRHFSSRGQTLSGLRVSIVGDVRHSRVARSSIWAHALLGNEVRLVGPRTLIPHEFGNQGGFPGSVTIHHDLREGVAGADVVIALRMQLERQAGGFVPNLDEYSRWYGLSEALFQEVAPDAVVLHPGPMNRGVEIASSLADGPRSLVTNQVTSGVAVRMAVLLHVVAGSHEEKGA